MDYEIYMKWYDEDHIAEIMETSGIQSAYRYIDVDNKASKPYLAFYPMDDVAFTQGEEFKKIKVKSALLPGTGLCYDLADIDVRYIGLIGKSGVRDGVAAYLFVTAIEPGSGVSDTEAEKWLETVSDNPESFRGNFADLLQQAQNAASKIPGYQRTMRFRLLYARTNAQSRALKGLPTTNEAAPEPPTFQAIHEFSQAVDTSAFDIIKNAEGSKKILSGAKQLELAIFKLAKGFGKKQFFDS